MPSYVVRKIMRRDNNPGPTIMRRTIPEASVIEIIGIAIKNNIIRTAIRN
jgi:hypothetical protein